MSDQSRKPVTLDDIERRHISNHATPYFNWIRQVVTLSTASLTALISLQGHYLPKSPKHVGFLAACWLGLGSSIALGLFALRAEYGVPLDAAQRLRSMRESDGDNATIRFVSENPTCSAPWHHHWAVRIMFLSFAFSLLSLCIFAILNLG